MSPLPPIDNRPLPSRTSEGALCRCGKHQTTSTSTTTGCCEYQVYRYLWRKFNLVGRCLTYLRFKQIDFYWAARRRWLLARKTRK